MRKINVVDKTQITQILRARGVLGIYEATVKALTDLELSITQKTKDRLNATVIARESQGTKITVKLVSMTKDMTKMSIRAGSFTSASRIRQTVYDSLKPIQIAVSENVAHDAHQD